MKLLAALFAMVITGCAVRSTGVVQTGEGTYMIGATEHSYRSGAEMQAFIYPQAIKHCAEKGLKTRLISNRSNDVSYYSGPSAEIYFSCY